MIPEDDIQTALSDAIQNIQEKHRNDKPNEVPRLQREDGKVWRDLIAFWILGLCNNYGYVVMLACAHDIIARFENQSVSRSPAHLRIPH